LEWSEGFCPNDMVEIVYEWNGYKEGDSLAFGGKLYGIIRVEVHHERGEAWVVVGTGRQLYSIDIPYEKELVE
jgi:hypothetical protein